MLIDKYLPKNKWTRSVFFLVYDICMVGICAFLALWVRFDMSVEGIPVRYLNTALRLSGIIIGVTVATFCIWKMYSTMWGGAGVREMLQVTGACFTGACLQYLFIKISGNSLPRSYFLLWFLFMTVTIGASRMSYRVMRVISCRWHSRKRIPDRKRVMIVGGGQAGTILIKELKNSDKSLAEPVCVMDDDSAKLGKYISGVPVKGTSNDIVEVAERMAVDEIYIALPSASQYRSRECRYRSSFSQYGKGRSR